MKMGSKADIELLKDEVKNLMRVILPEEFHYLQFNYIKRIIEKRIKITNKEFKKILGMLYVEGYWEWADYDKKIVRQNNFIE